MISISRHSKTMYVVRGSTCSFKNKLKAYGMKWTRKLKGGPGYVLRIRVPSDLHALDAVKKIVFDSTTEFELTTNTQSNNKKRKMTDYNNVPPAEKRIKAYHAPFEPVYNEKTDRNMIWILLFIVFVNYLQFTNITNLLNTWLDMVYSLPIDKYYDMFIMSEIEYSEYNFTISYPVINV